MASDHDALIAREGLIANRKAEIERTIAELQAAFPLAFSMQADGIKPLGIGIKQQIYARCTLSHRQVGAGLRRYTGRVAYLLKITEGAVRFDLDGAASGNVTAKEATHSAEQIKKILATVAGEPKSKIEPNTSAKDTPAKGNIAKSPAMTGASKPGPRQRIVAGLKQAAVVQLTAKEAAENRKTPQPPAMASPSNSGPRRLGLADLRQAAAARRTTKGARTSQI
jgi:sRNA-binding protein